MSTTAVSEKFKVKDTLTISMLIIGMIICFFFFDKTNNIDAIVIRMQINISFSIISERINKLNIVILKINILAASPSL